MLQPHALQLQPRLQGVLLQVPAPADLPRGEHGLVGADRKVEAVLPLEDSGDGQLACGEKQVRLAGVKCAPGWAGYA